MQKNFFFARTTFVVLLTFFVVSICVARTEARKNDLIERIDDYKDVKKLLRTKTNVLILFAKSDKDASSALKSFTEAAEQVRGQGTLAYVICNGESKKLCKKLKAHPKPIVLKHFKDGEFNKDYNRKLVVKSMVNFMRDPTGDVPWEEDEAALGDVVHFADVNTFTKFIKREVKPVLIMFYAPWCGFCKRLKPVYVEAASELRGQGVLAAMDVNKPENSIVRQHLNITGFPTLIYFTNGEMKFKYEGENSKEAIVSFMKNPNKPPDKPPMEPDWASSENSSVVHLNDSSFDSFVSSNPSVLVMFYAPWCGHCKVMKPEYSVAADSLFRDKIEGVLAAVDATKETTIASRYNIRGFPSVKYFQQGEYKYDVNVRTSDKIIAFMKDPKEPPPPPPPDKAWSETETETEIVHLDESNFATFLKRKKHVLVVFYAPWCGHCKKVKPEFSAAAARFKEDSRVAFGAVDCTTNSQLCVTNGVEGYPTIKYFSFLKTSLPYDGGRTMADFVTFMNNPPQSKSSSPLVEVDRLLLSSLKEFVTSHDSVLVLFESSDCAECQRLKEKMIEIAKLLHSAQLPVSLAVVDDIESKTKLGIAQMPTIKYYRHGVFISDFTSQKELDDLIPLMNKFGTDKDEL